MNLYLNVDELLYRFHLFINGIFEWVWYIVSFGWVFDSSSATGDVAGAGFWDRWVSSGLFNLSQSRPSAENNFDTIDDYLNQSDGSMSDTMSSLFFGTGTGDSIFSLVFGSFIGWFVILVIVGFVIKWLVSDHVNFLKKYHKMQYAMSQQKYVQAETNHKHERWQRILEQIHSDDVNIWKIAIIDADTLLDEVLSDYGYVGTVAEKLNQAGSRGSFTSVQCAHTAHGIRNKIAHDSSYVLGKHDAKSAISMFERFFNEIYSSPR